MIRKKSSKKSGAQPVKAKQFRHTIKRLWQYLATEKQQLLLIFLFVFVDSGLTLLAPYLLGIYIDAMDIGQKTAIDFNLLQLLLLILAITYIAESLLAFIKGWLVASTSQQVVHNLRRNLFEKLQYLPIAFFDRHTHGELMSRLTNDVDNVSNSISQSSVQLMSGLIAIVGSFAMMILLSPALTLTSLVVVPLFVLLTKFITRKTAVLFREQQQQLGRLNAQVEETVSGVLVVKAFNYEQQAIERFEQVNRQLAAVGVSAQTWSGFIMPMMNVVNNIGFAIIAVVGGVLAIENVISVGVIASFISYSRQFVRPLNELGNIYNVLQSGVAGAERVFEIMDEPQEQADKSDARVLNQLHGDVTFEQVAFGYRQDVPVVQNLSFNVPAGSVVALVGPTGAGKTSIVNLLTRFYDVDAGCILIDDCDIREYTRRSLRKCFGIVLQDTYLFSGTIRENIRYGNLLADDQQIEAAAAQANADKFIQKLPQGYDTVLTENGGNLSQGQKQLLAIARVILASPPLLILDEATSNIDTRTEFYIQDALRQMMVGKTSFVIAHRLNTIRHADIILVIDQGGIAEQGTHEELLEKQGAYYNMYKVLAPCLS